jgi:hypothetical protein
MGDLSFSIEMLPAASITQTHPGDILTFQILQTILGIIRWEDHVFS